MKVATILALAVIAGAATPAFACHQPEHPCYPHAVSPAPETQKAPAPSEQRAQPHLYSDEPVHSAPPPTTVMPNLIPGFPTSDPAFNDLYWQHEFLKNFGR